MDRGKPVLIAAASGRALAASARRAGYTPLVADAFGDQDTLEAAEGHVRVDLLNRPIDAEKVIAALDRLAAADDPAGIVCGSGFEDRPDLLARIAQRWPLIGNSPDTVVWLKDPLAFATLCRAAKIPHPETALTPPVDRAGWLTKRVGGAGGLHVQAANDGQMAGESVYFQRHAAGEPVSALLLGDGRRIIVLGFSAQWSSPTPRHPFRYGGAVRPAALSDGMMQAMTAALERLAGKAPLTGINSADFLVDDDAFHLLEVNPRPGATFDLFEPEDTSLFSLHCEACAGNLPSQLPAFDGAMAGAIVYAERTIAPVPALDWPDWTADRPVAGSTVRAGAPLCSVFAGAATAVQARQLVEQRIAEVRARCDVSVPDLGVP
jgi:predicted ATP-grasp superfamily ATP-dependent carboligase